MSVSAVSQQVQSAAVVGVSGSRSAGPGCVRAVTWALGQLAPGASVVTGCAPGIDAAARLAVPSAVVVRASAFAVSGVPPQAALARRSVAVVRQVRQSGGGSSLWVSAPGKACPAGLFPSASPSACFSGSGSGSWASLALVLGLGIRALVWLPAGVAAPPGWPLDQVCAGRAGAWWGSTAAPQATLF